MARLRILVVDDEPALNEAHAGLLRLAGHEVWTAGDGQRAAELAATHRFDLILSDETMPRMSGRELLHHLRAQCRRPFWFVLVTVHSYPDSRERVPGCDQYLTKPLHRDVLSQVALECAEALAQAAA